MVLFFPLVSRFCRWLAAAGFARIIVSLISLSIAIAYCVGFFVYLLKIVHWWERHKIAHNEKRIQENIAGHERWNREFAERKFMEKEKEAKKGGTDE